MNDGGLAREEKWRGEAGHRDSHEQKKNVDCVRAPASSGQYFTHAVLAVTYQHNCSSPPSVSTLEPLTHSCLF